jgi:beta-lactam-binding protein with PASTA domain
MEFIDGRALSSILRTAGPMHPDRAAEIGADVAIALAYAHRHGVIHRDVKPGNVLITEDGIVKVTDFGIARAINTEESLTQTGAVMGTATYFSPEQAEGMGVDARSDIYSLGVVLFEMVTGRPPFMGDTPVAVASKHVRENPPTPREINPAVPPDLEAIILKCLAKSPEYRYATGDDLRVDLLRFREGRAVGAVAPPMMPTMGTTQALPYGATQTLAQIAGQEPDEPERSRTGLYAVILIVLLAALAVVIIFLGQSLGWWHLGSGSSTVTVQNVAGQNVIAAEHTLHSQGLKTSVHPDATSSVPNTQVIRTDPAHGTSVKAGSVVVLITGGAGNKIAVPGGLVGQSVGAATTVVKGAGLAVKVQPTALCPDENIVCSTDPRSGARLAPGKTVTLFTALPQSTSTTVATVQVPGVAGFTTNQACSAMVTAGFVCGTNNPTASNLPVNTVVDTSPAAGTFQPKGTTINFNVSSGPAMDTVPNVSDPPLTTQQAQQAISAANLTPVVLCQGGTGTVSPDNPVLSQDPPGGTSVTAQSQVTVTVDCTVTTTTTSTTP